MDICLNNQIEDKVKRRKCIFNDEEIQKILNERSLIDEMRGYSDLYNKIKLLGRSRPLSFQEMIQRYLNFYPNDIDEGLNHINTFEKSPEPNLDPYNELRVDEEFLKINFNNKLKDSIEELREDIKSSHGYLLESHDNDKSCIPLSVNTRKLLRLLETNHYKGKKIPESFKNDIKIVINNMHLPVETKPIFSTVGKVTASQFCNNGKSIITCNRGGFIDICKYNDIMGKYRKEKTISCELPHEMVDVLISRNRDILYVPSYPGILSEINLKDPEKSESYVDRDVVVYIPDNNNINVIKGCCFRDSNEDAIICSSMDGNVYGYDIVQSQLLFKINSHYCVNDVCMIAPNNCNVFISAGPKSLNIFDSRILRTRSDVGAPIAIIGYNSINYRYISSRGDGNYVVGTCYDNAIKVYDIRYANKNIFNVINNDQFNDLRCIGEIPIKKCQYVDTICKAKFSPQQTGNRFIYTGCYNENISIFDLYTGSKVKTIKCTESSQISALDWHPFKNQIVAGATCGKVVCISDEKDSEVTMEDGKSPYKDHEVSHNSNNDIPNDNRRRLSKIRFLGQEYERHFPRLSRRQIDYSTIE